MGGGPIRSSHRRTNPPPPPPPPPPNVNLLQVSNPVPVRVYRPPAPYPPPTGFYCPQDDDITDEELNWVYDYSIIQLNLNRLQIDQEDRPPIPIRTPVPNPHPPQEVPRWADGYETDPGSEYVPLLGEESVRVHEHDDCLDQDYCLDDNDSDCSSFDSMFSYKS